MKPHVLVVGHIVWDHRFWTEDIDLNSGRTRVFRYEAAIGGPAAVAALTIQSLGGRAGLVSRVGCDRNGDSALQRLREAGVDVDLVERQPDGVTAVSAVTIAPNAERHIYPFPGTFATTGPADFSPTLPENAKVLLVDSRWPTMALAYAVAARAADVPVAVDLDVDNREMWQVVSNADFTICDEDMARLYGGPSALADRVEQCGSWAAVTLGSKGTFSRSKEVPAFRVRALDTTGAGDVFHGAFALAIAEGKGTDASLLFATAAAAVKCREGRIPVRAEVDALARGA